MIRIKADYNDFGKRYSHFLNNRDEELTIDIRPGQTDVLSVIDLENTPFATNSICKWNGRYVIAYNPNIIETCGLTQAEQDACIMHEIGHLVNREIPFDTSTTKEIDCDNFAVKVGLNIEFLSALCKMQTELDIDAQERINHLCSNLNLYRPEWTCGRYNAKAKVAIFYNLLEGVSYFFEEYSAVVISKLLEFPRNYTISITDIEKSTGIKKECIAPFLESLRDVGLILNHIPSIEEIKNYRQQLSCINKKKSNIVKTTQDKLPVAVSSAEMDYTDKAGGVTSVMFELTYRCSEKCIHCYNIGATRNEKEISHREDFEELTFEEYKRVIDELYEEGLIKVCLSGGDPFSKSIVWKIIDYLYKKEIAIDIFTNGQSIVNNVKQLADFYPRLVGISIYSGNSTTHDKITRVNGSWEKSISVTKQLYELGVPTVLKCCVMRPNIYDYDSVNDIAKKYGANVQYELNVTDSVDGDKCASHYLRLTPEMLNIVLQDDNTPMYVGKEAPNYGGQPKDMDSNGCGAGVNSFCITPDGDFLPCCSFHLKFGNIRKSSVADILKSSNILQYWQNLTLKQYEECGKHDYCSYCNLCPGNNYSEHGDVIKAGENNCYMAKNRWALATRLKAGETPIKHSTIKHKLKKFQNYNENIERIL